MPFNETLKKLRQDANLTQEQLADKASMPLGTVRNYEQGIRDPSWAIVVKLARALGVPTDAFTDADDVTGHQQDDIKKPSRHPRKGRSIGDTPSPPVQLPARHDVPASGPADANAERKKRAGSRKGK